MKLLDVIRKKRYERRLKHVRDCRTCLYGRLDHCPKYGYDGDGGWRAVFNRECDRWYSNKEADDGGI